MHSMALIAGSMEKLNVEKLSFLMNASRSHVSKVTLLLVKHHFLISNRGPKGGFIMKKKPEEISLLEIFEAFEGKLSEQCCLMNTGKCTLSGCIFGNLSNSFTMEFIDYLRGKTLSEITKTSLPGKDTPPCE